MSERLRRMAVAHALAPPTDLRAAIARLGFVQADPIQAPARAQDLILRPRVLDYRVGDLEADYPAGGLEEDLLYAYGFMPGSVRDLLHPRPPPQLTSLEAAVLHAVRGPTHPRDLERTFGSARVRGPWGGNTRATKRALDRLHMHGLLRVVDRRNGIRVYGPCTPTVPRPLEQRLVDVAGLLTHLLAPIRERTLRRVVRQIARRSDDVPAANAALKRYLDQAPLERVAVGRDVYLCPALPDEPPARVTFVAPFDPLVHDRDRFEQLWGWAYRFEAYTPPAKRVRGYYALPIVWGADVVGWVNVAKGGAAFDDGYAAGRPGGDYPAAFDAEVTRFRRFLEPR